ncbi:MULTISPECIES: hypothetical protein [unclassified Paenibacillus]|uniref:hypothetical protein n=1 Tax=Paenibacillus TaxID=44249 RepID=UPI00038F9698|nr:MULTISPECIES: hypothetical protein [unclassified Paenibacillus]KKC47305.1 non-ribosomal peptide synthetase module [Paenibacillus sp. D9]CDN45871.1 Putative uncharacterized protein [Paenibacillus sp. P22]
MAQRIATEYVQAKLRLTRDEMTRFLRFFDEQQVRLGVKVLDNGSQEAVLEDCAGREEVRFVFQQDEDRFVCEWSCRITNVALTNALRKAVAAFKGDAVVKRIYSHYTMSYQYVAGAVHQIAELTAKGSRIVYQFKDTLGELERAFRLQSVEGEIQWIQQAVNELLDRRIDAASAAEKLEIDRSLKLYSDRLFALEA